MSYTPRLYQQESMTNFMQRKKSLLHYTVSGGKTLTTLMIIDLLTMMGEVESCLIIAPLAVANGVWEQEIEKWGFDFTVQQLSKKTIKDAVKLTINNGLKTVTIINVDKIARYMDGVYTKRGSGKYQTQRGITDSEFGGFDMVVVDESTVFKRNSNRTKAITRYMRIFNPEYRLLLTGTPWTKTGDDIWYQYNLLFAGSPIQHPLGTKISIFRERYYTVRIISRLVKLKNGKKKHVMTPEYEIKPHSMEAMALFLKPYTDVVTLDDLKASLPDEEVKGVEKPKITEIKMELPKHLKKEYNIISPP